MALFVKLADELAVLLFGESPQNGDFLPYISRIDPKLGLIYWYVSKLREQKSIDAELAQLQLLIGMYALGSV